MTLDYTTQDQPLGAPASDIEKNSFTSVSDDVLIQNEVNPNTKRSDLWE